jgi:hypothetical protein
VVSCCYFYKRFVYPSLYCLEAHWGNQAVVSSLGNLLCYFAVLVFILSTFTKAMNNHYSK